MEQSKFCGGLSMQQYNSVTNFERGRFRAYFKGRYRLLFEPYAQAPLTSYNINVDAMAKATSTLTFAQIPNAVIHGDVVIVADQYGNVIYKGVINEIDQNTLTCYEIEFLFSDTIKRTSLEIKQRYNLDFILTKMLESFSLYVENSRFYIDKGNGDNLSASFWGQFTILTQWAKEPMLKFEEPNKEQQMDDFLRDVFVRYNGTFDVDIPIGKSNSVYIYVKAPNYNDVVKMANNSVYTPTLIYTTEVAENNKLVITKENPSKGFSEFYKAYYLTPNGISTDPMDPRDNEIKTTFVEMGDDDVEEEIVQANLNDAMFNHKINIDLILYNNVYDFFNYRIGQSFEIYINNKFFNSILTAYNLNSEKGGIVSLTFGKVRTKFSQKKGALL